jgi:hypothetical protein
MALNKERWQGWLDSNQRMAGSKPAALPLGDTPVVCNAVVASLLIDALVLGELVRHC